MELRWFNGNLQYNTPDGWVNVPTEIDPTTQGVTMCNNCGAFHVTGSDHVCWVGAANGS